MPAETVARIKRARIPAGHVLDGYQANEFLTRWVEEIEGWR